MSKAIGVAPCINLHVLLTSPGIQRCPIGGIYRRSVMHASGRYAMLDDGLDFSLVPWRFGGRVSWELRPSRGQGIA